MKFTLLFLSCFSVLLLAQAQDVEEVRRYSVNHAQQGVAVDSAFFYVINSHSITKHQKSDGKLVATWEGGPEGVVEHLNSGIIIDGMLYCTHSNFPASPMASSIEIFDPNTLTHAGNRSLGIMIGSATWIDRYDGFWWIGFAQYTGQGGTEGKDNSWTQVVKFDDNWQRQEAWIFPEGLIKQFATRSNSGGSWGPDGLLYCTGHDAKELYVLKIPEQGFTLQWIDTLAFPCPGQGIAWDRTESGILYGIDRHQKEVIATRIDFKK